MGMKQLQSEILAEAREVTGKKKLRQKDIVQWTSGTVKPRKGETPFWLPMLKVEIAVLESAL